MNLSVQKKVTLAAIALGLLSTIILADESSAEPREALSSRELASIGIAMTVTVRGEEDCGLQADSEQAQQEQRWREMFGVDGPGSTRRPSQGSGVVLTAEGEILTLSPEETCSTYAVTLPDGREVTADLVGFDDVTDVALLRVDADGLSAARIGDPNALRPGDRVLAVGSPFGMRGTVSQGIVSTTDRFAPEFFDARLIQSDAIINPGSSGGPLINEYGEVVGLHALIVIRGGQLTGMSFALPIDVAMRLVEDLREFGKVKRASLGVVVEDPMPGDTGALVVEVVPESPASDSIEPGDRIVEFGDKTIETMDELIHEIQMYRAGADVSLTVVRGDEAIEVTVTLAVQSED